jgi:hypothetical protein
MTLDELKRAAKRLRKHDSPLFGDTSTLTQAQALDAVSRLHGFRDYHEAHQRLTQRQVLDELLSEPGGLLAYAGVAFDITASILAVNGSVHIEGASGSGKTVLCNEIVVQALAKGRPVRIVDKGRSYRRLAQMLGGEYFEGGLTDASVSAWESTAPLVVLDAETAKAHEIFDFQRLQSLPANALVLCDEFYSFRHAYQPFTAARTSILVGQAGDLPRTTNHWLVFHNHHQGAQLWDWFVDGKRLTVKMHVGPRRWAMYSTNAADVQKLGLHYDSDRYDAFVASLAPVLR